jgi:hypothetical protein
MAASFLDGRHCCRRGTSPGADARDQTLEPALPTIHTAAGAKKIVSALRRQ